jgi:RHS repeat-associated protein
VGYRDDTGSAAYHLLTDEVGSVRVMTTATGATQFESDYYPHGGQRVITATKDTLLKFQGLQHDTESGLENAARLYSSGTGRFLSVAARPARKVSHPQELNKVSAPAAKPLRLSKSTIGGILLLLRAALSQFRQCQQTVDQIFAGGFIDSFGPEDSWVEILCGTPDLGLLSLLGGDCKQTTQPGPFPDPFEACANNGFVFAGPSMQCTGDRDCCLDKAQAFTDECEKRKGIRGAFWESLGTNITAACCKR